MNILLKKVDSRTYESTPQGGATLKDAEFTVYHYDTTDATSLSKDHDTRVKNATKKWVYKTDEYGSINLKEQDPVSGDEVYKNSLNRTVLPIGTYVIEKTSAPKGYLIPTDCDDRCYIEVVKPDGTTGESIDTFHHETYSPINNTTVTNSKGETKTYTGLGWSKWEASKE